MDMAVALAMSMVIPMINSLWPCAMAMSMVIAMDTRGFTAGRNHRDCDRGLVLDIVYRDCSLVLDIDCEPRSTSRYNPYFCPLA